ncbi:hypothetical protein [Ornithinimicrobium panacihumi]|uniref:hypothetical protein n=1 Tax=Ornithinimicrobium panacihumi TaxID=2008449 RepID=UPI003F8BED45
MASSRSLDQTNAARPQATFVAALAPAHIRRSPTLYVLDAIRREVRRRKHELLPQQSLMPSKGDTSKVDTTKSTPQGRRR